MGEQVGERAGRVRWLGRDEIRRVTEIDDDPDRRVLRFADACRINTLAMIAAAGSGHIGSSFSSMELVSWLYLEELGEDDVYFSSKGHDVPGLYAVLYGCGRMKESPVGRLRRLGGLPGHPDVGTEGFPFCTGSLGMGISKAKGLLLARRIRSQGGRVFVMCGDGELQEGQIWESLATAGRLGELTVIVDCNRMQSDTWVRDVSEPGDVAARFASYGWEVSECDGHDPSSIRKALRGASPDRATVVLAHTVKGKGVSFMEADSLPAEDTRLYPYHSGAPAAEVTEAAVEEIASRLDEELRDSGMPGLRFEVTSPAPRPASSGPRLVEAWSSALCRWAERDGRIVALDADLVRDTGLVEFEERFPSRFVECGIAEQDMVSQASGLAAGGLIPVVHSFGSFLSARPNEQVYNAACERRKIVYVGALAGLLPAGPGHSHQSVRELGSLGGVPRMQVLCPSTPRDVDRVADYVFTEEGVFWIRLCSVPVSLPFEVSAAALGRGRGEVVFDSAETPDVVFVGSGPVVLRECWQAAERLAGEGFGVRLVATPFMNAIDRDWLHRAIDGCAMVVTVEDHYLDGGFGERIGVLIAEEGWPVRLVRFGLGDVPPCGADDEVLRAVGLDGASVAARVRRLLG
ncbi:MAG: transketolase [Acidimicrobiales bacterium]|nr:MAG: transketolase [Acidimicrobiales bacterium]